MVDANPYSEMTSKHGRLSKTASVIWKCRFRDRTSESRLRGVGNNLGCRHEILRMWGVGSLLRVLCTTYLQVIFLVVLSLRLNVI
jgi:hypothetical protein